MAASQSERRDEGKKAQCGAAADPEKAAVDVLQRAENRLFTSCKLQRRRRALPRSDDEENWFTIKQQALGMCGSRAKNED